MKKGFRKWKKITFFALPVAQTDTLMARDLYFDCRLHVHLANCSGALGNANDGKPFHKQVSRQGLD